MCAPRRWIYFWMTSTCTPVMRRSPSIQRKGQLAVLSEHCGGCHPGQVRPGRMQKESVQWLLHIWANYVSMAQPFSSFVPSYFHFPWLSIMRRWDRVTQHAGSNTSVEAEVIGRNSRLLPTCFWNCVRITWTMCPTMTVISHFGNTACFINTNWSDSSLSKEKCLKAICFFSRNIKLTRISRAHAV